MTEEELELMIGTVAADMRHRHLGDAVADQVQREARRRCRRTRRLRTAAYTVALLAVAAMATAAMPAHRYDYVLGAHAAHPDVAYRNTQALLMSL